MHGSFPSDFPNLTARVNIVYEKGRINDVISIHIKPKLDTPYGLIAEVSGCNRLVKLEVTLTSNIRDVSCPKPMIHLGNIVSFL